MVKHTTTTAFFSIVAQKGESFILSPRLLRARIGHIYFKLTALGPKYRFRPSAPRTGDLGAVIRTVILIRSSMESVLRAQGPVTGANTGDYGVELWKYFAKCTHYGATMPIFPIIT